VEVNPALAASCFCDGRVVGVELNLQINVR